MNFWNEWKAGASGMETLHGEVSYQVDSGTVIGGSTMVEGSLDDWSNLGGFEILQIQEAEVTTRLPLPAPVASVVFKFAGSMSATTPIQYWCTLYVLKDPWKVLRIHITTTDPLPL